MLIFSNPSYEGALVGVTTDGRAVYDFDRMVSSLIADGMTEEEAVEFIEFNAIEAYVGEQTPVIVHFGEVEE